VIATARLQHPPAACLVPVRTLHLGARADPVAHAVAQRHVLQIRLDLGLRRVAARPARVRLERELVEVGGHVAGGARIGVVVPHAPDPVAALEDRHVLMAGAAQHHGCPDAAEAAADNGDGARPPSGRGRPVRGRSCAHGPDISPVARVPARVQLRKLGSRPRSCLDHEWTSGTSGPRPSPMTPSMR
jgi:hypothetical protein